MPIYNIGYGFDEVSESVQFSFDEKLSKAQLQGYVNRATVNALTYGLENPDHRLFGKEGPIFRYVFNQVVEELKKLGFQPIEFEAELVIVGKNPIGASFEGAPANLLESRLLSEAIPDELWGKVLEVCNRKRTTE